jgi:anti-sigma factor RsiW
MSSEHITELLDDYLQALLSPESLRQVQGHLAKCSRCRIELAELQALKRLLAGLPTPAPRRGVLERMLNNAVKAPAPKRFWRRAAWRPAGLGAAAAILVVLGFFVGTRVAGRHTDGAEVVLVAQPVELGPTVRRVGLMFRASDSLRDASITVWLPDDVEIAGRPNVRQLSWHTDLKAGANLLELPLLATGTRNGTLLLRLSQGSLVRTLELPIEVQRKASRATTVPSQFSPALT